MMPEMPIIVAGGVSPLPEVWSVSLGAFFPFFLVGMWLFVSWIIARGGWCRFAAAYGTKTRPAGRSVSIPGVTFGPPGGARYNSVVRAVLTEDGLYLYPWILFRAFHPPFLLPWSSIDRMEPYSLLWTRGHIVHVRDHVGTFRMYVREALATELRDRLPQLGAAASPSVSREHDDGGR